MTVQRARVAAHCASSWAAVPDLARAPPGRTPRGSVTSARPGEESAVASPPPGARHTRAARLLHVDRTHHRIVIAIDDFEGIDDASAGLLGALTSKLNTSTRNLVLLVSCTEGFTARAALG